MNKLIYILLIPVFCTTVLFSQSGWYPLTTGTASNFSSSFFNDVNTGYLTADSGRIFKTTNGGENWSIRIVNPFRFLSSIYFANVNTGYICGDSGYVLKTTNAGSNWNQLYINTSEWLHSIMFTDAVTGFIGGDGGTIFRTTDAGLSWLLLSSGTPYPVRSVYFTDLNTGYLVGGTYDLMGIIYKTTNSGLSWTNKYMTNEPINSAYFINDNTGYVAGGDPEFGTTVFKTTSAGNNWTQNLNPSFGWIYSIAFINSDTGYTAGYPGITKTTNGGLTWNMQNTTSLVLKSIYMVNSMTGYAAGSNGVILKTTTGGDTSAYFQQNQNCSYFPVDTGNVWVYSWYNTQYGQSGRLSRKVTQVLNTNGHSYFNYNSQFLRIDSANADIYYYTTTGGCAWLQNEKTGDSLAAGLGDTVKYNCGLNRSICVDTNQRELFGSMRRTKNISMGSNGKVYAKDFGIMDFFTSGGSAYYSEHLIGCVLNGIVYGDTVTTYYSISGQVRYQDNNQPVSSGYVKAIHFDSTAAIITIDSAQIQSNGTYMMSHIPPHISTDIMAFENDEYEQRFVPTYYPSTTSWQNAVTLLADSNLINININVYRVTSPSGPFFISGHVMSITESPSQGLNGAIVYAKTGNVFNAYSVSKNSGAYRADSLSSGTYTMVVDRMGFSGLTREVTLTNYSKDTIDFTFSSSPIGIRSQNQDIPKFFWLGKNYPNPFNPITKTEFGLPRTALVKLIVYDILGRVVRVLVNEELKAGNYSVTWNATSVASGIYFYRIESDDFTQTKKMVLIK